MSEASTQQRLAQCFQAVFPNLSASEIAGASTDTVSDWDSVAQVTLISVVEEEFGVMLAEERYGELISFPAWCGHLETLQG
jgi:acyl carrier protein